MISYTLPAAINIHQLRVWFSNGGMTEDYGDVVGIVSAASPFVSIIDASKTELYFQVVGRNATSFSITKVEITSLDPLPEGLTGGAYTCAD